MNWQTLDAIADSVNPVLGIIALLWPWLRWRSSWRHAALSVMVTLLSVAFAYAMSALDGRFGWWPAVGLDFSTHTAIAIALVVSLGAIKPSTWLAWTAILFGYFVLMVYQRYHTWSDIVTTAVVIAPPLVLARWLLRTKPAHAGQMV
jgi:hypothetical protein